MNDNISEISRSVKQISFFIYKYFSNLFKKNFNRNNSLKTIFKSKKELKKYLHEPEVIGLVDDLREKRKIFLKQVDSGTSIWDSYRWGASSYKDCRGMYSLVRKLKPEILVETGVCNGISTAFILLAMNKNKKGKLVSIDYPQIAGTNYEIGAFWEGKGGAMIPEGHQPGWVIPQHLRDRWTLIVGKSQDKLPPLLSELKEIDFFLHDSDHSYECMMFEYETVFGALKNKGILVSDDIVWNNSFDDFCKKTKRKEYYVGPNVGFLFK